MKKPAFLAIVVGVGIAGLLLLVAIDWRDEAAPANRSAEVTSFVNPSALPLESSASNALSATVTSPVPKETTRGLANGLKTPARPTWRGVVDYRQGKTGREAQEEVVAGLSFCASADLKREVLMAERSSVGMTAQTAALDSMVQTQNDMCARLSDADYELRSEILSTWAKEGDLEAMVAFHTAGPLGKWGATTGPQTLEDPRVKAWQAETISWLKLSVQQGQMGTLLLLADVYGNPPTAERPHAVFSDLYDPSQSYAYAHAWHYLAGRDASKRQALIDSGFLAGAEIGLSKEQLERGRSESRRIIESLDRK